MSEASRQRWLLLHNRLEELNAKYGPVDDTLPDWLDHHPAPEDQPPAPPAWQPRRTQLPQDELVLAPGEEWVADVHWPPSESPPAQKRVLQPAEAMLRIDRHHETPLFACPACGEESAKANVAINLWHCTACDANGKASSFGGPDNEGGTPVHVV